MISFGLGVVFVESNYEEWLEENLKKYAHRPWKICFWHRVANELNPGSKMDGIDVAVYNTCRRYGAIILTGN